MVLKKVLFLIHDLGHGGAEKVLINLVNNMDRSKFDVSVTVLFGGGVNEQFLDPEIHFRKIFPWTIRGNSKWMKAFTPLQLHRLCVKETYDIEVAYLEGPSARIISGCDNENTKLIAWIHSNQHSMKQFASSFRSAKEAVNCYTKFDRIVCVSQTMKSIFCQYGPFSEKCCVLYNTVESEKITQKSQEYVSDIKISKKSFNLVAAGTYKKVKGFERLLEIVKKLKEEKYPVRLYLLGDGPLKGKYLQYIRKNKLQNNAILLGYQINPYKYISKCDLFVCSSYSEGFSTAVTEALIVGTPVCTVDVSGMKEMLGDHNEYGIVTENDIDSLYLGIKRLLDDNELLKYYRMKAKERGALFDKKKTVKEVENMLDGI